MLWDNKTSRESDREAEWRLGINGSVGENGKDNHEQIIKQWDKNTHDVTR